MLPQLPTFPLAILPTPLHPLPRFSHWLDAGLDVWIKRDDLTGRAMGGNKLRKLEHLLADAMASGATDIITTGAGQSNHCRQTAAAASLAGLACHLVLRGQPDLKPGGNQLLDSLFGASMHWVGLDDPNVQMFELAEYLRRQDRRPYIIPLGGSNAIGAAAYAFAWEEMVLQAQAHDIIFDAVVFASSSGGTQTGLMLGAAAGCWMGTLHAISIDHVAEKLEGTLSPLILATGERLGVRLRSKTVIHDAYLGAGYGIASEAERRAILALARTEGLIVDPVYTGRALAGLIDLGRQGELGQRVLFWHTGGTPALFAYEELFS